MKEHPDPTWQASPCSGVQGQAKAYLAAEGSQGSHRQVASFNAVPAEKAIIFSTVQEEIPQWPLMRAINAK